MIPFGEWLPDQSDLNNVGATVAKNVIPAEKGYRPFQNLASLSTATDTRIRGFIPTKATDGTINLFCGHGTKLLKYNNGTTALDNVSKAGNYTVGDDKQWKFVQFGNDVIAAGSTSTILQKYTLGSSSLFSDISGSPSTNYLTVVKDFVVCANVKYSSTDYPYRVRWSQINDASSWTIGTNQADIQDLVDSGHITGLCGGESGVVLCERGIYRMVYVGTPLIFTFQKITEHGCTFPNSVASLGPNQVFYLSQDGFFMFNGSVSIPIGADKVDVFFNDDLNANFTDRISCSIDPVNQIVAWSYASTESTGDPDKIIMYNYASNRWSIAELEHEFIGQITSPSRTLESLDDINSSIDAHTLTFDSPAYAGGKFLFAASKDKKIQTFSGANLAATLETTEFEPKSLHRSLIKTVSPIVTKGAGEPTITVQVGSRSKQTDSVTFTSSSSLTSDNFCNVRSNGRYHRIRVNAEGNWRFALGVDVDAVGIGKR
tara:strand:+ start:131 stop:1591 length:1461 start_codon:yes stop_codon:yes gene_type:complete